jgi:hypothetical protein
MGNKPPRAIGSAASPLLDYLDGSHHDVTLSEREQRLLRTWIDAAATYAGTYAASGTGKLPKNPRWPEYQSAAETIESRCAKCHTGDRRLPIQPMDEVGIDGYTIVEELTPRRFSNHVVYNFSRPAKSLMLLAPLARTAGGYGICSDEEQPVFRTTGDSGYQKLLAIISRGAEELQKDKRFDMPGFRPSTHYVRIMKDLGILPKNLPQNATIDVYATDEAYWQSFWPSEVNSNQ